MRIKHLIALLLIALSAHGQTKVAAVSEQLQPFIEKNEVAGVVTLVATPTGIAHVDAIGKADIAENLPMKPDSICWIASMSKPVTGVAVMMIVEEGKLSLEDPVSKHIPELANLKTADGKSPVVTIRHLLTHTSGMGEINTEQARSCTTLEQAVGLYAQLPLRFEPGSRWTYCQSSINTAARVVEVVSGQRFDEFLDKRLFGPLGMKDTTFYLSESQLPRLAKSYTRTQDGKLDETPIRFLMGKPATSRDRFPAGNGGLFSTALDYARLCQMLLNDGTLEGKQILKPQSVATLSAVHSGELTTGFTPGNAWGVGVCIVRQPQGVTAALSPNSYGHGGAYGTQAWIDPTRKLAYILMCQRANFPNSDASDVRKTFQDTAAMALAK